MNQIFWLVRRDLFCAACKDTRGTPHFRKRMQNMTKLLFCTACVKHHPRYQFSVRQRGITHRVCIGQEGYFRTCPRASIKWEHMKRLAENAKSQKTSVDIISCRHCDARGNRGLISSTFEADVSGRDVVFSKKELIAPIIRFANTLFIHIDWAANKELCFTTLRDVLLSAPEKREANAVFCPHVRPGDYHSITGLIASLKRQETPNPRAGSPSVTDLAEPLSSWMPDGQMKPPTDFTQDCRLCRAKYSLTHLDTGLEILCLRTYTLENTRKPWWEQTPNKVWWLWQLDPGSWRQQDDDEGRHVTWCPDRGCYRRAPWGPKSRGIVRRVDALRMGDVGGFGFDGRGPVAGAH